jgi:hypothetical protein
VTDREEVPRDQIGASATIHVGRLLRYDLQQIWRQYYRAGI